MLVTACREHSKPRPVLAKQDASSVRADAAVDAGRVLDPSLVARLDALAPVRPPPKPVKRRPTKTGDCSTKYAPRPDRDPSPMCRIKGGTFQMGGGDYVIAGPASHVYHAPRAVTVDDFLIDQYEVSAAQAANFLEAHGNICNGIDKSNGEDTDCVWIDGRSSPIERRDGHFVAKPGRAEWPADAFTWEGALRYCAWVGKNVPSSAQWEYAARHDANTGRDFAYPWGDSWTMHQQACNADECDQRPSSDDPMDMHQFPVGTFDGSHGRRDDASPWGPRDMSSSAAELVIECDDPMETCRPGAPCDCRLLETPSMSAATVADLRAMYRIDETDHGRGSSGVRCAYAVSVSSH